MIGRLFYRDCRIMNLLAAIGIGFLVLDPEQMFDASFSFHSSPLHSLRRSPLH